MTPRRSARQGGSLAVAFAVLLMIVVIFAGLAIDLALAYTRRMELREAADAAALAAAAALDGTSTGIANATAAAEAALANTSYKYGAAFAWSDAALSFAAHHDDPDSAWVAASAAGAADASTLRFARFDTSQLAPDPGIVDTILVRNAGATTLSTAASAVAGPALRHIDPIAICALSATPAAARSNTLGAGNEELVEYGFRRGVTYNLIDLNPNGTAAQSYAVNPVDFPGAPNYSGHFAADVLKPFMCTGLLPAPATLTQIYVSAPFPAASLYDEINVRLQLAAAGKCKTYAAAPDTNVREFVPNYPAFWMGTQLAPYAQADSSTGARLTIADLATPPAGASAGWMGTLWAYTRPVRYSASAAGNAGTSFGKADWSALYPTTPAPSSNYADSLETPYLITHGTQVKPPSVTGQRYRRILNVPLLSCPVPSSGVATVLAIGKFMLTARASASAVPAEFGGLASDPAVSTSFTLYQ
ncbi:MAG TPA: pilus assembly protein TadG-related protein [Telluria sp.]|nr:pilus assembly protein TadG-related protein [Telluria sp.]